MSHSGSAMTISSSTSHGIPPATEAIGSAMPRRGNDQRSEGSSARGSRGGVERLHEAVKRFDERSRCSDSVNEDCQVISSSEDASMTRGEVFGPGGPPASLQQRIAAGAKAKAPNRGEQAMPNLTASAGMGRSTASSSQGPQAPVLPTMSATPREQTKQQSHDHQPMAAEQSSDSGNTIPYEDQNEPVHEGGGDAAFMRSVSHGQVGVSDDSMSQVTETARPKKGAVTLTVEDKSDSSGNTEFYEDPTQQDAIRGAAGRDSIELPTAQGPVAMPPEEPRNHPTPVSSSPMGDQSLIVPPMLPLARSNPTKRRGSDDIERERTPRTRTPSPQARMPLRSVVPQLPPRPDEGRLPDGYVPREVAEQEVRLIQQRYAQETLSRSREAEEMARGWAAMQGQQHQLAERLRECERELERFRRGEGDLREELDVVQASAQAKRSQLILEERSMIHAAEERSARRAMEITEAQAEERHTVWKAEVERARQGETRKLRLSLEDALRQRGAMPEQPCPGCISRNLAIAALEEKNDVLERQLRERNADCHRLEAECAEQTSRLSYDLDKARQSLSTTHAAKAGSDAENAAAFKRMKFLEAERESMTQQLMKVLSENAELHSKARKREAMPETTRRALPKGVDKGTDSPPNFFNIGGDADEEEEDEWGGPACEDEEWCYAPAPVASKVGAQGRTMTQTMTRTAVNTGMPAGSRDGDATSANSRPPRPPTPNGGSGGDGNDGGGDNPSGKGGRKPDGQKKDRPRYRKGGDNPGGGDDGGDDDDDDPGWGQRRPTPQRRDDPADGAMPNAYRKREGEEIKTPPLPRTAADLQLWLDSVANAVTACAVNPETSFEWIARTEDDDVGFDELGVTIPEFVSLDAKLRAALTKNAASTDNDKQLVNTILAKSEELKRAMPRRQIKGRQIVLLIRQFFEVKEDRRIQYEVTNLLDVTYSGDARMSQFKHSWDNMVRNLRCNILVQEPKTLEHIFYKVLKNSDALRPYLQYYDRLRDDHPDRTYTFLSEMVDKAIREERHRKNQEALIISASGGSKAKPSAPGVHHKGDAFPRDDYKKGKSRGDSPAESDAQKGKKGKGKGKGKGKEKGKVKQDPEASSGSDFDSEGRPGRPSREGALRTKDLAEDEVCCINHLWRICVQPDCRYKHKEFLHKDARIRKHVHFLALSDIWGPPTGKRPDGWKPRTRTAMPATA